MARSVKPYLLPERWMVIGERRTVTAGQKSRQGEESRDEGLDESERGDMDGLANGELPCCSTREGERGRERERDGTHSQLERKSVQVIKF